MRTHLHSRWSPLLLGVGLTVGLNALANQQFPLQEGELAVTYSSGSNPGNLVVGIIDTRGTPPANSFMCTKPNWSPPAYHNLANATEQGSLGGGVSTSSVWNAGNLGEVFGLTLDTEVPPNIYVTHTTSYGPSGLPGGVAYNSLCPSGNTAGTIIRLDGKTGIPSCFAQLPQGSAAVKPGLGNITWDPVCSRFYATNFADNRIYVLQKTGNNPAATQGAITATYAHGVHLSQPNGFEALGTRLWGIAVHDDPTGRRRIYYGVWGHLTGGSGTPVPNRIYSIPLTSCQLPASAVPPQLEVTLPSLPTASYSSPPASISFDVDGRMLVAERGMENDMYPFPRRSEVLRYQYSGGSWSLTPPVGSCGDSFCIGRLFPNVACPSPSFPIESGHNATGGVAGLCRLYVPATADPLDQNQQLSGVQGTPYAGGDINTPTAYFVDLNGIYGASDITRPGSLASYAPTCRASQGCCNAILRITGAATGLGPALTINGSGAQLSGMLTAVSGNFTEVSVTLVSAKRSTGPEHQHPDTRSWRCFPGAARCDTVGPTGSLPGRRYAVPSRVVLVGAAPRSAAPVGALIDTTVAT